MVLDRSVRTVPSTNGDAPRAPLVFMLASIADTFFPWGHNLAARDKQLRDFWPTEPTLASAIYNVVTQRSAFSWTLDGPPRTVKYFQDMLHASDIGQGWHSLITKCTIDLLTQDNGAFIEVVRSGESENSPVINLAHLDAGQCRRTGNPDFPVVYVSRDGREHKLRPWQVLMWTEFPSPVETMNGAQLCAVSRILRAAQLLRDIGVYLSEKAAGKSASDIYLVSGIKATEIDEAMEAHMDRQRQKGLTNYVIPLVMATLDPTSPVSVEKIQLASLPENFDLDTTMKWYINQLALGFGADYQDFAPLPGSNLGTSTQSLILHMKSRGKGPGMWRKSLEYMLNFHGVLPQNVTFRFDEQDTAEDMEIAELEKVRAEVDKYYFDMGVYTAESIRQMLFDRGKLTQEEFDALNEGTDITPDVTVTDSEPMETEKVLSHKEIVRDDAGRIIEIRELAS